MRYELIPSLGATVCRAHEAQHPTLPLPNACTVKPTIHTISPAGEHVTTRHPVTGSSSQKQPANVKETVPEPASNEEEDVSVKAPQTFNEALAALRGELAVIPNYERVMSTVSVVSKSSSTR